MGRGCLSVPANRNASGKSRQPTRRVRRISSLPPSGRILSPGHRGGQQHGVATELDGAGRFGSRANARIEYDRDSGVLGNMLDPPARSQRPRRRAAWRHPLADRVLAEPGVRGDFAGLAVDVNDHRARPPVSTKRSSVNGAATLSNSPLMISREMTSAVIGVSSTPLR
jgi:hypothetical protein